MEFQKDLTLKELDKMDFVSFYQIFKFDEKNYCLDLWDCNQNLFGCTKKYSLDKIQKFLSKSLLQEL